MWENAQVRQSNGMPKGQGNESYWVSSSQQENSGDLHGMTRSQEILRWSSARGILGSLSKMSMWLWRMSPEVIELGWAVISYKPMCLSCKKGTIILPNPQGYSTVKGDKADSKCSSGPGMWQVLRKRLVVATVIVVFIMKMNHLSTMF